MKKKISLSTQAFRLLQEKFVNLELEPGSFVTEQELCTLINLGRMPVKEALNRLAQLQLVQVIPRKGIRIPSIEWNDVFQQIEIYRGLRIIQYKWVAKVIEEPQKQQLQKIYTDLHYHIKNQDYITHEVTAEEFHQFCQEQCYNKYINHMIEPMRLLQKRVFNKYYQVGIQAFKAMGFARCDLINAIIINNIPLIEKYTSKIFDETENAYRKIYATFL